MTQSRRTTVARIIHASPAEIYAAFLDPDAIATWLPPGNMRGLVHAFEGREGGAFSMSLIYGDDEAEMTGKTSERIDRFSGKFVKLISDELVVWATTFDTANRDLAGEMIVSTHLVAADSGTEVTMITENIPPGIRLEDNEIGCRETLQQLAAYLGG